MTFDCVKHFSEWLLRFLFLLEPSTMVVSELLHCNSLLRLVLFMIISVLGSSREREPTGYIYIKENLL